MSRIGIFCLTLQLTLLLLGAVSRLTHGRVSFRAFYAYQLARAPDDASTWFLPYCDLLLAGLLVYKPTRALAALLCAGFQFIGVVVRVRDDKEAAADLACVMGALVIWVDCLFGGL